MSGAAGTVPFMVLTHGEWRCSAHTWGSAGENGESDVKLERGGKAEKGGLKQTLAHESRKRSLNGNIKNQGPVGKHGV